MCSSGWFDIFMEDDEISCYGCQAVANGEMNVIVNKNAIEKDSDESDIDWENEALDSGSESEVESLESNNNNGNRKGDIDIQTNKNGNNDENNGNNGNNGSIGNNNSIGLNILNSDMAQIKYDINRKNKQGKYNKNKFKKQKTNNNFNKNAKNRKFKIVKNKNKNKSKSNVNTSKNIRIKRKKKHEQDKQKQKQASNKRQQEKKQLIMRVKEEKIKKIMSGNTKLNKENIKFIGNDENIVKAALGIRIEALLKETEISTDQIIELINTSSSDDILGLINNENIVEIVLQRFKNGKNKEKNENENENENDKSCDKLDPRDRDKGKFNDIGIDSDGMGVITETRGMNAGMLEKSGDEKENGNENGNGNGNENESVGDVDDVDDDDVLGVNGGLGTGNINSSNSGGTLGVKLDIFEMNGIDVSKYNMGFGMGFDNKTIDGKINELQNKAKDGVEKVVDNKAYTINNPSMADL